MISVKDNAVSAPLRVPHPAYAVQSYQPQALLADCVRPHNSGYPNRQPLVAVATNCSGTQEDDRTLEAGNADTISKKFVPLPPITPPKPDSPYTPPPPGCSRYPDYLR